MHVSLATIKAPGPLFQPPPSRIGFAVALRPYATLLRVQVPEFAGQKSPIRVLEVGSLGIGSLGLVCGSEATTDGVDSRRNLLLIQAPAGDVHQVNPVGRKFPVAKVPEPLPVVVDQVGMVRPLARRSQPQIPVKPGGNRFDLLEADGLARAGKHPVSPVDVSDDALLNQLGCFAEGAVGTSLSTGLDDTVILARRLQHLLSFEEVVADRLLHVDMLARLAGPDRGEGVPVVTAGDSNHIDLGIVQDPPEVRLCFRPLSGLFLQFGRFLGHSPFVRIADDGDFDVVKVRGLIHQTSSPKPSANQSHPDPVVGSRPGGRPAG